MTVNKFTELYFSLKGYKDDADGIIDGFLNEDSHDKKTYRNEVYLNLHTKKVETFKYKLDAARERKVGRLNSILNEVQDNLKCWLTTPINDRTLNTVCALHSCGVKLNDSEIEALRDSLGNSYFGQKLLQKIAKDSGVMLLSVKNVDSYTRMISNIKISAELFVYNYCGSEMQGLELLGKEANVNLAAASCNPAILKDGSTLLQASLLWDGSGIPFPRKKMLTREELAIISKMYEGFNGADAQKARTAEILASNPDMREVIGLSPYAAFIEDESA